MTTDQAQNERRRWNRLPICVPMFIRWTDDRQRKILEFATALNVSAGGALLAMHRYAPIGTKVSIEIPCAPIVGEISLQGAVNHLNAEVVRVEASDKAHLVAASFSTPITGDGERPSALSTPK
jgi:hypothetical protein